MFPVRQLHSSDFASERIGPSTHSTAVHSFTPLWFSEPSARVTLTLEVRFVHHRTGIVHPAAEVRSTGTRSGIRNCCLRKARRNSFNTNESAEIDGKAHQYVIP